MLTIKYVKLTIKTPVGSEYFSAVDTTQSLYYGFY